MYLKRYDTSGTLHCLNRKANILQLELTILSTWFAKVSFPSITPKSLMWSTLSNVVLSIRYCMRLGVLLRVNVIVLHLDIFRNRFREWQKSENLSNSPCMILQSTIDLMVWEMFKSLAYTSTLHLWKIDIYIIDNVSLYLSRKTRDREGNLVVHPMDTLTYPTYIHPHKRTVLYQTYSIRTRAKDHPPQRNQKDDEILSNALLKSV